MGNLNLNGHGRRVAFLYSGAVLDKLAARHCKKMLAEFCVASFEHILSKCCPRHQVVFGFEYVLQSGRVDGSRFGTRSIEYHF